MEPLKVYFYTQGNSITTANQCGIQLLNPLGDVTFGAGGSPWAPILTYPFKYNTMAFQVKTILSKSAWK